MEAPVEVARDPAVLGPEPERAVGGLEHRREAVAADALSGRAIEQRETKAVEADHAVERRRPEITVASHVHGADDVLRESLLGGPDVDAVLRDGELGVEQEQQRGGRAAEDPNGGRRHAVNAGAEIL